MNDKKISSLLIWMLLIADYHSLSVAHTVEANHRNTKNHIQKRSSAEPVIILHDNTHFGGKEIQIDTTVDNLEHHTFSDRVSSLKVKGGTWVLYEHSTFRGKRYVVGEGDYPHWDKWNGENDQISSVRPMSEEPKITLFDDKDFEGKEDVILNQPVGHLARLGFDNQVSSIKIEKGIWVLFQDPNFKGKSYVLNEGYFPGWEYWHGNNDEISSLCPLNQCPFEDDKHSKSEDECDNSVENCGLSMGQKAGIAIGTGALAFFGAPVVLGYLGFTAAGITGGSVAAGMMSAAASTTGGGVAAGSTVAVLQSIGAAGLGAAGVVMTTAASYASADIASRAICGLKNWKKNEKKNEL